MMIDKDYNPHHAAHFLTIEVQSNFDLTFFK
ncbi:hypothetical protein BQ8482_350020 [Mesorhizobium delmotii]|uniref:Uncharacterized protein n=1 Tax=Mesorhizobium delmotii TaxID=1631247 RepID=A0A2P9AQI1_9HYPH|nr:hypothetical protein BQ8482_350020 [Mesorhizobium delmotii]